MITRKEKRERGKGKKYFFEFTKIQRHFFKDFIKKLKNVNDPRVKSYISYDPDILLYMVILKNVTGLLSMRSMTNRFNKQECIDNIGKVLNIEGLEELPHYDTINNFLSRLDVQELENIRNDMIKELLKKRCFDEYRILGKYWAIIFDGTGLFSFHERHCEHCLKREITNKETGEVKTIYMHHVLEAKLVVGDMVFSIGSEFIENESENVTKQDCELNAFYRLAKKIKQTFKRLPICILGDSLYACEPIFNLCDEYKWKYLCRFKEGRIQTVAAEFEALKELEHGTKQPDLCWVNDISYHNRNVNIVEFIHELKDGKRKKFVFITSIKITKKNAEKVVAAGRSRWKIENQGFNHQKNIQYDIEHANSHNYTAMKNHYLLVQISDILWQLYEKGAKIFRLYKRTAKEKSSDLLEAIRSRKLTDEDMTALVKPIQVRFT